MLSSRDTLAILLSLAVTLAASPAISFAQTPPPPRPGADGPPPKPGGGGNGGELNESHADSTGAQEIIGEIWVDNWFRLFVNGTPLLEDSVAYRTERSFNAERVTFSADLPMTLAFEFRDFMENETGLEYIGTRRQQMGDGGAIAQFRDRASGKLLAVTGADWRCLTVQAAPADASCARAQNPDVSLPACAPTRTSVPDTWTAPGFDDSGWPHATVHSARDVGPKHGYDRVDWDRSAKLIWGPDLKKDNILYCRVTVGG
ncbi:PEBP family protein [Roseibium sp.]|uniref:PEBP family protein n=2 Tax=Roseibium sp. TaxID=1936156 RepID=UPI003266CD37